MIRLSRIPILILSLCFANHAHAQQSSQLGLAPGIPYDGHGIDNINLMNGNAAIRIPILAYPERGSLGLSFSLIANTSTFREVANCNYYSSPVNCIYSYVTKGPSNGVWGHGPEIIEDHGIGLGISDNGYQSVTGNPIFGVQNTTSYHSETFLLVDASGAEHQLWLDSTNHKRLRATDGSGYSVLRTVPVPQGGGTYTIYDAKGNTTNLIYDSTTTLPAGWTTKDPDGLNSITFDGTSYNDHIHALVPAFPSSPPANTNSTTGCPTIQSSLAAVASRNWTVPGYQGASSVFLICYTDINVRTNFLGNNGNLLTSYDADDGRSDFYEFVAPIRVIQSVVRPDGKAWGFLYDSGADEAQISYGDLAGMTFPDGGSVTYEYQNSYNPCGFSGDGQEMRRFINKRTLTDKSGNSFRWLYKLAWPTNYVTPPPMTTVTDPNNDDTVHIFQGSTPQESCISREILAATYQGAAPDASAIASSTKVPVWKQTTTYYPSVLAPEDTAAQNQIHNWANWTGYSRYVTEDQPYVVSTFLDGVKTSVETKSFDAGSLSVASLFCRDVNTSYCLSSTPPYGTLFPVSASLNIPNGSTTQYLVGPDPNSPTNLIYGSYSNTTQFKWQSDSTYLDANLLGTPEIISVQNADGNPVSKTTNVYDDSNWLPSGHTGKFGHITQSTQANDMGDDVVTNTGWTTTGMVDRVQDGRLIVTQLLYDTTDGAFAPSSSTRSGETTTFTHDLNTGVLLSSTDANSQKTVYSYDPAGRPWSIQLPDIQSVAGLSRGQAGESVVYCYPSVGTVTTMRSQDTALTRPQDANTCPVAAGNSTSSSSIYDGLGHLTKKTASDSTGVQTQVDMTFDGLGNVVTSNQPYAPGSSPQVITNAYDALNRPTLRTLSDSTEKKQWQYAGVTTTYIDEALNQTVKTTDGQGRLIALKEPNDAITTYGYNTLGNLVSVHQPGLAGEVARTDRSFVYDSLSRLIQASNPESGMICYGQWTGNAVGAGDCRGGYDGNGNVKYKTDANNVTVSFGYDNFNRVTSKSSPTPKSARVTSYCYQFGAPGTGVVNGVGRLVKDWAQMGGCTGTVPTSDVLSLRSVESYDAVGRVKQSTQCVLNSCTSGSHFSLAQSYDLAGSLTSWNDGINLAVFQQQYDAMGRVQSLTSPLYTDSTHPANLFSVQQYNAAGTPVNWTLGNNLSLARGYDSRWRVTWQTAIHP